MVTVGDKIRKAREAQNPPWSQYDLADKLQFGRGKIAMWESGKTHHPKQVDIQKAADLFGIPIAWFYDGKDTPVPRIEPEIARTENDDRLKEGFVVTAAVRTWASALAGLSGEEDCHFEPTDAPYEVPIAFLVGGYRNVDKHDLVNVSGRSMVPLINPGDRVLFYQDNVPRPNTVVMAQDPEGRVFIKVLRDVAGKWQLKSIAEDGATFVDLKDWKLCGYAVAILGDDTGGNDRNIRWPFGQPIKA